MTNVGSLAKAINAQNVAFSFDILSTNPFITLFNITFTDESTLDRRNTRGGSIDTPTFNLVEFTADLVVDDAVYDDFVALRILSSAGKLPSTPISVKGSSIDGSSTVLVTASAAVLRRLELIAAETGRYHIRATFRIDGNATYSSPT